MSEVYRKFVKAEDLQATIQDEKDAGRRILAISPSKMKKTSIRSSEFEVTEFVILTQ